MSNAFTRETARQSEGQNRKHGAKGAMTAAAARAANAPTAAEIRAKAVPVVPHATGKK